MPGLKVTETEYVNAVIQDLGLHIQSCAVALQEEPTLRDYANIIVNIKASCDIAWSTTLPYHHLLK